MYALRFLSPSLNTDLEKAIWTNLSRSLNAEEVEMISRTGSFWKTQDQGAAPMMIGAFDPGLSSECSDTIALVTHIGLISS